MPNICTSKTDNKKNTKLLNKFVKERTILNRKRRRFNARLQAGKSKANNAHNIKKIDGELQNILEKIKESIHNEKLEDERRAIDTIRENPKYF